MIWMQCANRQKREMISRQQYHQAGKENDLEITVSAGRKGK
jgi:hypothetical protein